MSSGLRRQPWVRKRGSRKIILCASCWHKEEGAFARRVKWSQLCALLFCRRLWSTLEHAGESIDPVTEYSYSRWRAALGGGWVCQIDIFCTWSRTDTIRPTFVIILWPLAVILSTCRILLSWQPGFRQDRQKEAEKSKIALWGGRFGRSLLCLCRAKQDSRGYGRNGGCLPVDRNQLCPDSWCNERGVRHGA